MVDKKPEMERREERKKGNEMITKRETEDQKREDKEKQKRENRKTERKMNEMENNKAGKTKGTE